MQQVYVEEEPDQKAVDPNLSKLLANTFISSGSMENSTVVEKLDISQEEEEKFEFGQSAQKLDT